MTKQIPLHGKYGEGKFALVDDADFETLSQYKWYCTPYGYVMRPVYISRKSSKSIYMHREIMNAITGQQIDHADNDKLNNSRTNLRFATTSENHANITLDKADRHAGRFTSRYKGVFWEKRRLRWVAVIAVGGKNNYLGVFLTQHDAAIAYNKAAIIHFGEFARLNKIDHDDLSDTPVADPKTPKTSHFRGVSKHRKNTWKAQISIDSQTVYLGCFLDEMEAAAAYDVAARIHHGQKAKLNFP